MSFQKLACAQNVSTYFTEIPWIFIIIINFLLVPLVILPKTEFCVAELAFQIIQGLTNIVFRTCSCVDLVQSLGHLLATSFTHLIGMHLLILDYILVKLVIFFPLQQTSLHPDHVAHVYALLHRSPRRLLVGHALPSESEHDEGKHSPGQPPPAVHNDPEDCLERSEMI